MAIAQVGALGAVATGTTSVTPAFGQATTAGNLLVAVVASNLTSGGSITTSSSGWVAAETTGSGVGSPNLPAVGIWYKSNCGASETAPTFTNADATLIVASLSEWSGAATSSVVEAVGLVNSQNATDAVHTSVADAGSSNLAIACFSRLVSKSATATFADSWTPSGGVATSLGNTGGTKQAFHFAAGAYLLSAHGGSSVDQDSQTVTLSQGVPISDQAVIVSFLPASAAAASEQMVMVI